MRYFRTTDICAQDIMSTNLYTVSNDMLAMKLVEKFSHSDMEEAVILSASDKILGLLTKKRLMRAFAEGRIRPDTKVSAIMQSDVVTIAPESDILEARQVMRTMAIGRLPIVNQGGRLLGMLSAMKICNGLSEKLESISEQMQAVLDTIAEGLLVIDSHGKVIYWNKGAEDIFGICSRDILQQDIRKFIPDAYSVGVLVSKREIRNMYCVVNGRHLVKNASPIFRSETSDQVEGVVCTILDITKTVNLVAELHNTRTKITAIERKAKTAVRTDMAFITKNAVYGRTLRMAEKIAATDAPVLILGESGTGKEILARAIHRWSRRCDKVFITINSAAIPASLCESEFFGYAPGAFTGASRTGQPGKFELANNGTIFLDEIGELPLAVQAKLLRVLEYKTFYRIGGTTPICSDIRILTATNRNLENMVREGTFRKDLYYRLNVFSLKIPALRDRKEDIVELLQEFIAEFSLKYGCQPLQFSAEMRQKALAADWMGNIRELRNFAERIVVLGDGEWKQLFAADQNGHAMQKVARDPLSRKYEERSYILALLAEHRNNKAKVARLMNIPRSTLYYKLKLYHIE